MTGQNQFRILALVLEIIFAGCRNNARVVRMHEHIYSSNVHAQVQVQVHAHAHAQVHANASWPVSFRFVSQMACDYPVSICTSLSRHLQRSALQD